MNLNAPLTAQIEITDVCNFRCTHCYLLDTNNSAYIRPKEERILGIAKKLIDANVFNIILTGGEPLTSPNLLKKLIIYLRTNSINVSVNTNLSLLDDEMLDFFVKQRINHLLISCPSADRQLYEQITQNKRQDIFFSNLKKVIDSGLNYTVNMVVSRINKHDVRKTAIKLHELGISQFGATPMSLNPLYPRKDLLLTNEEVRMLVQDLLWIEKNLNIRVDIMESLPKCVFPRDILQQDHSFLQRKCQAGLTVIAVSPQGDVRPCTHNSDSYGNILVEDIATIWERMKTWRTMELIPEKCKTCSIFYSCHGGCRVNAKTYHGNWNSEDVWMETPLCEKIAFFSKKQEIVLDKSLCVVSNLKRRQEGDFILVCGNSSRQCAVLNQEGIDFIDYIVEKTPISIRQIAIDNDISIDNEKFLSLMRVLLNRNIIKYC